MESVELTKKGKPRKRKPKTKNVYFTLDTQDAILVYRNTENLNERNKIYNSKIHNAFYKLVENIIHTYKFYQTEVDDLEDLKYDILNISFRKFMKYLYVIYHLCFKISKHLYKSKISSPLII